MVDLNGQPVLVAGGAGFVGSALVRELLDDGARVVVYDNFLHGTLANLREVADRITIVSGDALDPWKLMETMGRHDIQYIFNCVGDTFVPTAYDVPRRFFQTNLEGNLNMLVASRQFRVKRMLYVSSTEVYGEAKTERVDEDAPQLPLNTYAVSKLAADRLCFTYHQEHDVPVVVARIFNCYGPRETEPYVIPEIISQLARSNRLELGNVNAERDFTYVHDTARWLVEVLKSTIPDGEAVNVGSDVSFSVRWLAETIAELMGVDDLEITTSQDRMRRLDIEHFRCDRRKLESYIDATPGTDIYAGLRKTIQWFRDNGERWSWEEFTYGSKVMR